MQPHFCDVQKCVRRSFSLCTLSLTLWFISPLICDTLRAFISSTNHKHEYPLTASTQGGGRGGGYDSIPRSSLSLYTAVFELICLFLFMIYTSHLVFDSFCRYTESMCFFCMFAVCYGFVLGED